MSEQLQFIIVVALGGLCFGCGYLVAFIVTRKHASIPITKNTATAAANKTYFAHVTASAYPAECRLV